MCVERLLSTPGIDVNIKNKVVPHSWFLNNQYSRGSTLYVAYYTFSF